jgi:hypothetical protein
LDDTPGDPANGETGRSAAITPRAYPPRLHGHPGRCTDGTEPAPAAGFFTRRVKRAAPRWDRPQRQTRPSRRRVTSAVPR